MPFDETTTRPAGTGGVDLSGINIALAIFKALGGGYGGGSTGTTIEGDPIRTDDWTTNFGDGTLVDGFDFGTPPTEDPNAPIKLLSEDEGVNPFFDMFGTDEPHFANGGPDGVGIVPLIAAVAVVIIFAVAADHLSDGAVCDALGLEHDTPPKEEPPKDGEVDPETGLPVWQNQYRDADSMEGGLQSPAAMFASLLGQAGIAGVDPNSPAVTDLMGKIADNLGKVTELIGKFMEAAKAGDMGAVTGIVEELMVVAGLDPADFDMTAASMQDVMDNMFQAFGVEGGMDNAWMEAVENGTAEIQIHDTSDIHWVVSWDDLIA